MMKIRKCMGKRIFLLYFIMSVLLCVSGCSQTPVISERNQLFIDFLKQEMLYHNGVVYAEWPFENIYKEEDSDCSIELDPSRIREQLLSGFSISPGNGNIEYKRILSLPHRVNLQQVGDSMYNAQVEIAVPDSMHTFQFEVKDIGKAKEFDKMSITLMQVEGNIAYLLLEDKSRKHNYSYTKTGYRNTDDEDTIKEADTIPQYYNTLDIQPYPNNYQTGRLKGSVFGGGDGQLYFETLSEDFRHYLFYRNMDMPYPAMKTAYEILRGRYKEENEAADNRYHPLNVVRLQASGNIEKIQISVLSRSRHLLKFDHEQQKMSNRQSGGQYQDFLSYAPSDFKNETSASIAEKMKVAQYAFYPLHSQTSIVAYMPISFNIQTHRANLAIRDLKLVSERGDTIPVDIMNDHFFRDPYIMNDSYARSVANIRIAMPSQENMILIGKVRYTYPNFEIKRYNVSELPEGISYADNTLRIGESSGISFYSTLLCVYDENGKMMPARWVQTLSEEDLIICKRPIAYIVIAKEGESIKGAVPFSLPLVSPPSM